MDMFLCLLFYSLYNYVQKRNEIRIPYPEKGQIFECSYKLQSISLPLFRY